MELFLNMLDGLSAVSEILTWTF